MHLRIDHITDVIIPHDTDQILRTGTAVTEIVQKLETDITVAEMYPGRGEMHRRTIDITVNQLNGVQVITKNSTDQTDTAIHITRVIDHTTDTTVTRRKS